MTLYFEIPAPAAPRPGSRNIDAAVRGALKQALAESGIDRDEIAARLTELLGHDDEAAGGRITKATLDAWCAPSKGAWRFPLAYLPALVEITGAHWLLDVVAAACGCKVLVGEQALLAQYGLAELAEREARAKKQALKKAMAAALDLTATRQVRRK